MECEDDAVETPTDDQTNDISINSKSELSQDSQDDADNAPQQVDEKREKLVKLPIGKVKNIVKSDPDVNMINQEAVFLITKSTEMFIDSLAKEAYKYTIQSKKKTVQKKDVEQAVDNVDALAFLEGMMEPLT